MSTQPQKNDISSQLGTAPVGKLLLKLAAPTVVAQLVNLLYNIVTGSTLAICRRWGGWP